jgi:hypothetical protein
MLTQVKKSGYFRWCAWVLTLKVHVIRFGVLIRKIIQIAHGIRHVILLLIVAVVHIFIIKNQIVVLFVIVNDRARGGFRRLANDLSDDLAFLWRAGFLFAAGGSALWSFRFGFSTWLAGFSFQAFE